MRRLANSIRKQDWTAVVIEFLLLVSGVFLGIQVANWNAERADDVRASAYLARIKANLETDLGAIQLRQVYWQEVSEYGNSAIRYAETGQLVQGSAWKTVVAFYQASQVWPWATTDTTYRELLNGGELALIRDEQLREALSKYYIEGAGKEIDYLLSVQPEYRKIVRGATPSAVSAQIWAQCSRDQQFLPCEPPISESQAQALLDIYLKKPKLLSELRFWVTSQQIAIKVIATNHAAVTTMLESMPQPK